MVFLCAPYDYACITVNRYGRVVNASFECTDCDFTSAKLSAPDGFAFGGGIWSNHLNMHPRDTIRTFSTRLSRCRFLNNTATANRGALVIVNGFHLTTCCIGTIQQSPAVVHVCGFFKQYA